MPVAMAEDFSLLRQLKMPTGAIDNSVQYGFRYSRLEASMGEALMAFHIKRHSRQVTVSSTAHVAVVV
jgi:hypothetical protein